MPFLQTKPSRLFFNAVGTLALACGNPDPPPHSNICQDAPPTEDQISAAEIDHACSHTQFGPFGEVNALETGIGPSELRNTHMLYTVALAPDAGQFAGTVELIPRSEGIYLLYLAQPVDVIVSNSANHQCRRMQQLITLCPGLVRVAGYELKKRERYQIRLGPSQEPRSQILVEEHFAL